MAYMGGGGGVLKYLLRVTLLVGFTCFLLVGMVVSSKGTTSTPTKESFKRLGVIGRDTSSVHHQASLDPNVMSKRRVPNGPDPIHNRRAGKSVGPPGRA
ncbi:hypothetical protein GIB67_005833 [Kingdonia uniflora]|uniref:CLAVATA3/ESR (CLE)-related protein 25 n=1 Tax=Kingdonia uniflora TaxID=39325 RepID=A0A7J7LU61_9MAGN|nr:hypothetical protein GIB67_005833 [Kingdonia uniflora]